jgi:hypothetical protein
VRKGKQGRGKCNPQFREDMAAFQRDWERITTPRDWTDQDLLDAVREFIGCDRAAVVLLVALHRGTNVQRLAALTGYPVDYIQQVSDRMQKSGLWKGENTNYDWNSGMGLASLALDTQVAEGIFVRTDRKKNGRFLYELVDGAGDREKSQRGCQVIKGVLSSARP